MANIKLGDLQKAVMKQLTDYTEETAKKVKESAKKHGKNAVRMLKQSSPRDTGEYAGGWRSKVSYESELELRNTVYNKQKPQITHLLENDHAGPYGKGTVKARPHIEQVEKKVVRDFEKEVEEIISGGNS